MAYAAARMADSCMQGLDGQEVYECSYVPSGVTELPYFSTKVKMGPSGAEVVMDIGEITEYEQGWLDKLKTELKGSIDKGIGFASQ